MNRTTFDETIALEMYHDLKTDGEIERTLGKKPGTIASWRRRRKLPSISIDPRKQGLNQRSYQTPANYREELTVKQCEEMSVFLRDLSFAGRRAVQAGVKPDVGEFINCWSGR